MGTKPLRILVIGAHPDDCELKAGGVAAMYRALGHVVRFVSVTNGDAGHHQLDPETLAKVRRSETELVTARFGIEYELLSHRDGQLQPSLEARREMIALIRRFHPDLILTHRPNDYHPDHRATATLVCDAAYMVIVPHVVPEVPALRSNPVIAYLSDHFQTPAPFSPSVVVDIEPVLEQVFQQMECHTSQFFEWLPYTMGIDEPLPPDSHQRRNFLKKFYDQFNGPLADRYRDLVIKTYGPQRGAKTRYIEAFQGSEYGAPLNEAAIQNLFPFFE